MGRITMTIVWAVVYVLGLLILAGLAGNSIPKDSPRFTWLGAAVLVLLPAGVALIVWQGWHGNLPGAIGSGRKVLPFLGRLAVWSIGLAMAMGGAGALAGYLAMRTTPQSHGSGILVVIPATLGCMLGWLAGAIVAVVKTFR